MKTKFALCFLVIALIALAIPSAAQQQNVLGTEDGISGFVGQMPVGGTTIYVASDGEAAFDPFGYGHDTSDQIALDQFWQQTTGSSWLACASCAVPGVSGLNVFVMPACDGNGVCENGNVTELPGRWDAPGAFWNFNGAINYYILDANGAISDTITIGNFGPTGDAAFMFQSDGPVPEPGSMLLLGSGLVGLAGTLKRKLMS